MISAEPMIVGRVAVGRMHFLSVLLVRLVVILGGLPVISSRQVNWHLLFDEHRMMLNHRDRNWIRDRDDCLVMMRMVRCAATAATASTAFWFENKSI